MEHKELSNLYDRLNRYRSKFGICMIETKDCSHERELAIKIQAEPLDAAADFLKNVPDGASFVKLDANRLTDMIHELANHRGADKNLLVYNIDLLLSKITEGERGIFWSTLSSGLAHTLRNVALLIPEKAASLLPEHKEKALWESQKRLI